KAKNPAGKVLRPIGTLQRGGVSKESQPFVKHNWHEHGLLMQVALRHAQVMHRNPLLARRSQVAWAKEATMREKEIAAPNRARSPRRMEPQGCERPAFAEATACQA